MAQLVAPIFGNSLDGVLTIGSNTTDAPIDSACTGSISTLSLTATNASFAAGQKILIHQSIGTGVGQWEVNQISSYVAGTITLSLPLAYAYVSGAQVLVLKQYSSVTVTGGFTLTAKAWNGTTGGILAFLCSGIVTVTGSISATGKGYRGGASVGSVGNNTGFQGEGSPGAGSSATSPNANGGGAGGAYAGSSGGGSGGAGGGHGTAGSAGTDGDGGGSGVGGTAGATSGSADFTSLMSFGGGGGSGGNRDSQGTSGTGGAGGGIILIFAPTQTVTGTVVNSGSAGANASSGGSGGGGGGAGGSIFIKGITLSLGSSLVTAAGGAAGGVGPAGGAGGSGRIRVESGTISSSITTSPSSSIPSTGGAWQGVVGRA